MNTTTTPCSMHLVLALVYDRHGAHGSGGWSRRARHRPLPRLDAITTADLTFKGASILFSEKTRGICERRLKATVFECPDDAPPRLIREDYPLANLYPLGDAVPTHYVDRRGFTVWRDASGRLHREDGPASIAPDGRETFALHGIVLPTLSPSVEDIRTASNAEVRRVLIERFGGFARYAEAAGLQPVHTDEFGSLYRAPFFSDGTVHRLDDAFCAVKVICPSTGREYFLNVDPTCYRVRAGQEARAAVASTWRHPDGKLVFKTPEKYQPQIQA